MLKTIERLKNGEKAFIICMGDSITEQNSHTNGRLNYVGLLHTRLIEEYGRNLLLLNSGISGNTSSDLIKRIDEDVFRFSPDLVTVMVGINDAKHGIGGINEFQDNIKSIVRQTAQNNCELLLLTQNPLNFLMSDNNIIKRESYPEYIAAIRDIADKEKIPLCDINQKWEDYIKGEMENKYWHMMNDGLHPNEYGHEFMAEVLFEYFKIR